MWPKKCIRRKIRRMHKLETEGTIDDVTVSLTDRTDAVNSCRLNNCCTNVL